MTINEPTEVIKLQHQFSLPRLPLFQNQVQRSRENKHPSSHIIYSFHIPISYHIPIYPLILLTYSPTYHEHPTTSPRHPSPSPSPRPSASACPATPSPGLPLLASLADVCQLPSSPSARPFLCTNPNSLAATAAAPWITIQRRKEGLLGAKRKERKTVLAAAAEAAGGRGRV